MRSASICVVHFERLCSHAFSDSPFPTSWALVQLHINLRFDRVCNDFGLLNSFQGDNLPLHAITGYGVSSRGRVSPIEPKLSELYENGSLLLVRLSRVRSKHGNRCTAASNH